MNLEDYFASVYHVIKIIFDESRMLENSVLIGTVREHVASHILSFFPEPKETGWIFDHSGKHTGQLDIVLVAQKAMRIPGLLFANSPVGGFFSTQVCSAFEIKSRLDSNMDKLMTKTWECHRLLNGLSDDRIAEVVDGHPSFFQFGTGVPICVIGNSGFAKPETYLDNHYVRFHELEYKVDGREIEKPTDLSQVIPDLLLDFTNDTLLVKSNLNPFILKHFRRIDGKNIVENTYFTAFKGLTQGQALIALLYYIDTIRLSQFGTQLGAGTPLYEYFKAR